MKSLWYRLIRFYVTSGLFFYYKSIKAFGVENIPKNKPILFIANHRNGLLDPIVIAIKSKTIHHFLTRASAFKNPIADFLLRSINMIPIYRIRDGLDSIALNQEVFENCHQVFDNNGSVMIFPEGNHDLPRRLRPLKKGFIRIAYGFLDKHPKKDLYIVPVGINYEAMLKPFTKVSLYFGKPILANNFYDKDKKTNSIEKLRQKTAEELKKISVHIESKDIAAVENQLLNEGIDFTKPNEVNERVKTIEVPKKFEPIAEKSNSWFAKIVYTIFSVNAVIPLSIWRNIKKKVSDPVMRNTFRFGLGLGFFSLFYLIQTLFVGFIFNGFIGFAYLLFSLLLTYLVSRYYHYQQT